MSVKLLPCPFCGHASPNIVLQQNPLQRGGWLYEIICAGCSVTMPADDSEEAIIAEWNTRAAQAAAPGGEVRAEDISKTIGDALHLGIPASALLLSRYRIMSKPIEATGAEAQEPREPTLDAINAALSEYFDVSPRTDWTEPQRVAMRKAIGVALSRPLRE